MKKFISTLLLLVGIVGTTSATDYDLYVAGTRVTSKNASKVMTGVSYDATNKILTLNNASISTDKENNDGIWNTGIDGLTIKVIGTCTIKSTNGHGFCLEKSTTILGDDFPRLTVYGSNGSADITGKCGIWMRNGNTLTIENIWLYVYGGYLALTGTGGSANETLNLKRCSVNAKLTNSSATGSAVSCWKEINTWGVSIDWNGNKFDSSTNKIVDSSGKNTKDIWMVGRLTIGRYIMNPKSDYTLSKSNVSTGISAGTIKWVASSKELQLDGVSLIDKDGNYPIAFYGYSGSSDPLNIWLSGSNSISVSNNAYCIWSRKSSLVIDGQSRLSSKLTLLNSSSYTAINCGGAKLNIGTVSLAITSKGNCIEGNNSTELTIGTTSGSNPGATLNLLSQSGSAIRYFKSCMMNNTSTSNATYFNTSKNGFTNIGASLAQQVKADQPTEKYDCYIFGNQLNNVNCKTFACEGVDNGTIEWANSSKTLYLSQLVSLNNTNVTSQAAIRIGGIVGSNVTINVNGDASVKGGHSSIYTDSNLKITGTGNLVCDNTGGSWGAILGGASSTVTLSVYGTVYCKGKHGYNSNGNSSATNKLVLQKQGDRSQYIFEGTTSAVSGLRVEPTLTNMDYYSTLAPGCYYDNDDKRFEQNGGSVPTKVAFSNITERYGIYICGTQITDCNAAGIGSKYISSGTTSVSYAPASKRLTLKNAAMAMPSSVNSLPLYNTSVENLDVFLSGENVLTQDNNSKYNVTFSKTTRIIASGSGSLVLNGKDGCINQHNGNLTIQSAKVTANSSVMSHQSDNNASITIDNSTVRIGGNLYGFGKLYLSDTYLIEPAGGKYDTSKHILVDSKGVDAKSILFGPYELLGIEGLEADDSTGEAEVKNIYDLNGAQQTELKRGVNIIRMSDGTVRKVIRK